MITALVVSALCGGVILGFGLCAMCVAAKEADIAMGIEEPMPLARRKADDAAREAMGVAGHE